MYKRVKVCKDHEELDKVKEVLERKDIPVVIWEGLTLIVPEDYYSDACMWASTVSTL